jgi:hypothetical protein
MFGLQYPMTDVAMFLLPSFQGPGDDHQRALLHAVSALCRASYANKLALTSVLDCAWTAFRDDLQVVHGTCVAVDVTSTHLSLNDKSRWRQASVAVSVLQQRRARLQLPQVRRDRLPSVCGGLPCHSTLSPGHHW